MIRPNNNWTIFIIVICSYLTNDFYPLKSNIMINFMIKPKKLFINIVSSVPKFVKDRMGLILKRISKLPREYWVGVENWSFDVDFGDFLFVILSHSSVGYLRICSFCCTMWDSFVDALVYQVVAAPCFVVVHLLYDSMKQSIWSNYAWFFCQLVVIGLFSLWWVETNVYVQFFKLSIWCVDAVNWRLFCWSSLFLDTGLALLWQNLNIHVWVVVR